VLFLRLLRRIAEYVRGNDLRVWNACDGRSGTLVVVPGVRMVSRFERGRMNMMREHLIELYLDWVNNWISADAFAEHHELTREEALGLVDIGKRYHEESVLRYRKENQAVMQLMRDSGRLVIVHIGDE